MACGCGSRSSTGRIGISPPARARLKYALSAAGIVDLIAVLPFWFALVLPDDLRVAAGVPHRALLQDRALFAGHALAARRALSRAARAVRLPGDHAGHRAGGCRPDASCRRQGAAGQARHHPRRAVVGDRHPRHHRLWRRGAGHRARQADRHRHHLPRPDHDRAADRHHRHRLRRADSPPRFHRHLGHDRARAAVRRARRRRDLRHHGAAARAGGGSRAR